MKEKDKLFKQGVSLGIILCCWAVFSAAAFGYTVTVNSYNDTAGNFVTLDGKNLTGGFKVQLIQTTDGKIYPPAYDGQPQPPNQLIKEAAINAPGVFWITAPDPLEKGTQLFVRAWDEKSFASPCAKYGNSDLHTVAVAQNETDNWSVPSFPVNTPFFNVGVLTPNAQNIYLSGILPAPGNLYTISWQKSATAATPAQWKISYSIDGGQSFQEIAKVNGAVYNNVWQVPNDKDSGQCKISVEALDGSQVSRAQDLSDNTFTIDNTPPGAPIDIKANPPSWANANFSLSWANPDDLSGINSSQYNITPKGGAAGQTKNGGAGSFTIEIGAVASGTNKVTVWLVDKSGNVGSATSSLNVYPDKNAPSFTGAVDALSPTPTSNNIGLKFDWSKTTATKLADSSGLPEDKYYFALSKNDPLTKPADVKTLAKNTPSALTGAILNAEAGEGFWYLNVICRDNVENLSSVLYSSPAIWVDTSAPVVDSFSPAEGKKDVPIQEKIVIKFSDEMNPSSVKYTLKTEAGDAVGDLSEVWSKTNFNNDTLTIAHADFKYSTAYKLTLLNTSANNVDQTLGKDNTLSFATALPSLPGKVSDLQALANPETGNITVKWTNPAAIGTFPMGVRLVYSSVKADWNDLKSSGSLGGNIGVQDLLFADNKDPENTDNNGGGFYILKDLSPKATYYLKAFSYVNAPGGTFFNSGAADGDGVKVAAMPQKAAPSNKQTFTFEGPDENKFGINTFGFPFDISKGALTRLDGTPVPLITLGKFTVHDLIKEINTQAGGNRITVFGYYDAKKQPPKLMGISAIEYSGADVSNASPVGDADFNQILAHEIVADKEGYQITLNKDPNKNNFEFSIMGMK
jgi:hypothetical protein